MRAFLLTAMLGSSALLAIVATMGRGSPVFADPEEDCENGGINGVNWNGAPVAKSTTSSGLDFSYEHAIIWCFADDPDFGSFEARYASSTNIVEEPEEDAVQYSPLYFYPSTHYGVLPVTISGKLDSAADGVLVSRVNMIYPYRYHDGTLNITYSP